MISPSISSSSSSSISPFPLVTSLIENLQCQYNSENDDEKKNINTVSMINLSCDSLLGIDYFNINNCADFDSSNAVFDYVKFDPFVKMLSKAISAHGDRIKRVDLCWDFLQFVSNKESQHALFRAISNIPNLKHLYVCYDDFEMQTSELEMILELPLQLETLELNHVVLNGTEQQFKRLCHTFKSNLQHSLRTIKLYNVILPTEKSIDPLVETLSQLKQLQSIELDLAHYEDTGISKQNTQALCQMPNLTSLELEAPELSTKTITGIAEGIAQGSSLTHLFLGGDNLNHTSAKAIANALQKKNCNLENLNLSFESSDSILHDSQKMPFSDADADSDASSKSKCSTAMENALLQNSSLKELTLNGCSFSDTVVSNILQQNSTLKSLFLINSKIQEGSCIEIANTLCNGKNSTLQYLCLRNNRLGEDSGLAIANMLKLNTTLKSLEFANNDVGEHGWKAIASSLKFNQTLEALNIDNSCWLCNESDNRLFGSIRNSFIDALQHNYVIKEISTHGMDDNNAPSDKLNFYLKLNSSNRRRKFFENTDMDHQHWLHNVITSQTTSNLSELHYFFRSMPSMLQKQNTQQKKRKSLVASNLDKSTDDRIAKRVRLD